MQLKNQMTNTGFIGSSQPLMEQLHTSMNNIFLLLIALSFFSTNVTGHHINAESTPSADNTSAVPVQASAQIFDTTADSHDKNNEQLLAKISTDATTGNHGDNLTPPALDTRYSHVTTAYSSTQMRLGSDIELERFREIFLQAENAIKKNDDAEYFFLLQQLADYPLFPYLQYQWLKKHLSYDTKIKKFLQQHATSRYASRLKHRWLHHLARQQQWTLFLQFYSSSTETKLICHHLLAQFNTGNKHDALEGAKKLWVAGYSQPDECDPVFSRLKDSGQLTQNLLWQRFDAALQNNKVSLAGYVKNLMPPTYHASAELWINLHHQPLQYLSPLFSLEKTAQSALMFSHAIDQLANSDISTAIKIWDTRKAPFNVDKNRSDKLEKRLAFKLAFEGETDAYQRFSQLNATNYSSRSWRVRAALAQQNWANVLTAIQALNEDEIKKSRWQYWLARAYQETGEAEKAQTIFTQLSTRRNYYGFLAASRINSLYQLSDNPLIVSAEEIASLKNHKEFRVVYELKILDRELEAKLQWWHALRELNKNEIITAAKLAQQWQWDEIAIFTIARAKHWDDIALRFPLSFADKINKNARQQNLNPAILFALIRRESAFNVKAYSSAGARGLMQIMPQTGRQIARHFNERWYGSRSLYDPVKNLKYGAYYYQKLLTRFGGNHVIALAAYNAGQNRVKQWLPEDETMAADIWIETIPFYETREYVKNVLAYTLIYQMRKQRNELSMSYLAQDILPLVVTP